MECFGSDESDGCDLKTGEEFLEGFTENIGRGDEAEDEVIVRWEVVEVAGVEEDVVAAEQVDDEVFVGGVGGRVGGVAEDCVPAGFGMEEFAGGVGAELGLEVGAVFAYAGEELRVEGVALGEECGESGLGRGA